MLGTHDRMTDAIGRRDGRQVVAMARERFGPALDWGTGLRLDALVNDRLVNGDEMAQVMIGGRHDDLERMLRRLETEREAMREDRARTGATMAELREQYDFSELGLRFDQERDLETLLEEGRLDPAELEDAIRRMDTRWLAEEIERRQRERTAELGREGGRTL